MTAADAQRRLEFTPTADREAKRRMTNRDRVLERLELGPATSMELAQAGGYRFSARLGELKAQGMRYDREDHGDHSIYTMTKAPER